jgi:hypothetical protein
MGFRELADHIGALEGIPSRIARPVADRFTELLGQEFDQETNPYGVPWAELADSTIRKKGHDQILFETGELSENTIAVPLSGAGIELRSVDHGQFHQAGDPPRMPARKILPDRAELPLSWQNAIREETEAAFKRTLKR